MIKTKIFNDPIHGHIELLPAELQVMDTPHFQRCFFLIRLRELKQLGVTHLVYVGATHTRFQHSIGVCHLAGLWLDCLSKNQPELEITDSELKCVRLAGLCHDLGHGPFSHLFDNGFMKEVCPSLNWTHEQASMDMLDDMVEKYPNIDISHTELCFIKDVSASIKIHLHKYLQIVDFR